MTLGNKGEYTNCFALSVHESNVFYILYHNPSFLLLNIGDPKLFDITDPGVTMGYFRVEDL